MPLAIAAQAPCLIGRLDVSPSVDLSPRFLAQASKLDDRQRLRTIHGLLEDAGDLLGNRAAIVGAGRVGSLQHSAEVELLHQAKQGRAVDADLSGGLGLAPASGLQGRADPLGGGAVESLL